MTAASNGWASAGYDYNKILRLSKEELEYTIKVSITEWYCNQGGQASFDERFHEDCKVREAWWGKERARQYHNKYTAF